MHATEAGAAELLCGGCGYDLRAIGSDHCPECGRRFDPDHLIERLIPWERRRYSGIIRAFLQTAWMATFCPRLLASRIQWPVDRRAAVQFHILTVALLAATIALAGWFIGVPDIFRTQYGTYTTVSWDLLTKAFWNPLSFGVAWAGVLVGLALCTVAAGCWYHPRAILPDRQNRAVAISHYACAPLAFACASIMAFYGLESLRDWWQEDLYSNAAAADRCFYAAAFLIISQAIIWLRGRRSGRTKIHPIWIFFTAVLLALGFWWSWGTDHTFSFELSGSLMDKARIIPLVLAPAMLIWWWLLSIWLMKLTTGCRARRAVAMAVMLPLVWLALFVIGMLTVYAVYFLVAMLLAW